eukprot:3103509-Rhodomonas_salina.1
MVMGRAQQCRWDWYFRWRTQLCRYFRIGFTYLHPTVQACLRQIVLISSNGYRTTVPSFSYGGHFVGRL